MSIRPATLADIPQLQRIRRAVRENALSDPALVSDENYVQFLLHGAGWVAEEDGTVAGFAIADLKGHNIWALFVDPAFERRGLGRLLHDAMLDWYFSQTAETVWLSTAPGTRAEGFYRRAGWREAGMYGKGELRFEMDAAHWRGRLKGSE